MASTSAGLSTTHSTASLRRSLAQIQQTSSEIAAAPTAPDFPHGLVQHPGQFAAAVTITLQQVQGHALGGARTDAGQAAQCRQQRLQQAVGGQALAAWACRR